MQSTQTLMTHYEYPVNTCFQKIAKKGKPAWRSVQCEASWRVWRPEQAMYWFCLEFAKISQVVLKITIFLQHGVQWTRDLIVQHVYVDVHGAACAAHGPPSMVRLSR